jgi:hypothetical protein
MKRRSIIPLPSDWAGEAEPERREPFYHTDHPRPRTRREFLGQGFLAGAATILSPSLFGLLNKSGGNQAYAQAVSCRAIGGGAGRIPFIGIDLAGGANIAGSNVLVGQAGGHTSLLSASGYSKLGLPASMIPGVDPNAVNLSLGLPFHNRSAFLAGIVSKAAPTTLMNTNGAIFCARSSNDTQNNPLNPAYGIAKTGSSGGLLTLIGTEATESGGNSVAPMSMIDPALRPTKIDRPEDAKGLVDTGRLVQFLDSDGADSVMAAVKRLSDHKVDKMTLTESVIVTELVRCSYTQSAQLVSIYSDPNSLDPRLDPLINGATPTPTTPIFDTADFGNNKFRSTAAVMKLVIEGHAGAGTLEFGGYDYHDASRATGEVRDFEAGVCMGACLEYAARSGQDLCLYVFSDGSVQSSGELDNSGAGGGKGIWRSDSSSTAAAFMLVYSPNATPALVDPTKQQIGQFKADGSVEIGITEVDNNPAALTEAVVLNYLALHNEKNRLAMVLPGHTIGTASPVDDLIAFDKIRN